MVPPLGQGAGAEARIPVVVLTARDEGARAPSLAAGAQAFLQKPVESWELAEALAALSSPR